MPSVFYRRVVSGFTCAVISLGSLQVAPSSSLEVIQTSRGALPSRISASPTKCRKRHFTTSESCLRLTPSTRPRQ